MKREKLIDALPSGDVIEYRYNAEGMRVVKKNGEEVRYLMDGLSVLCEYDGSGNILREYVPGISMKENGNTYYYITDRLGNVRYILDGSGAAVQSYLYSPFGQIHSYSGNLDQPYQFHGRQYRYSESSIGLNLLGGEWYDPKVGRPIKRDTNSVDNPYFYTPAIDEDTKSEPPSKPQGFYGNWCGRGWSGGEYPKPGETKWDVPAVDSIDQCCKEHDACFQGYDLKHKRYLKESKKSSWKRWERCNVKMCECLKKNVDPCDVNKHKGVYIILEATFCNIPKVVPKVW